MCVFNLCAKLDNTLGFSAFCTFCLEILRFEVEVFILPSTFTLCQGLRNDDISVCVFLDSKYFNYGNIFMENASMKVCDAIQIPVLLSMEWLFVPTILILIFYEWYPTLCLNIVALVCMLLVTMYVNHAYITHYELHP